MPLLVRKKAQGCSRAGLSLARSTQSLDRPQRSSAKSTNDPNSSCLTPVREADARSTRLPAEPKPPKASPPRQAQPSVPPTPPKVLNFSSADTQATGLGLHHLSKHFCSRLNTRKEDSLPPEPANRCRQAEGAGLGHMAWLRRDAAGHELLFFLPQPQRRSWKMQFPHHTTSQLTALRVPSRGFEQRYGREK